MKSTILKIILLIAIIPAAVIFPRDGAQNIQHFSRPEDRGEDFRTRSNAALLHILLTSSDRIEHRKAAKVLGDRQISASFRPNAGQQAIIEQIVMHYAEKNLSEVNTEREEARQQIHRLWQLAVPALLILLDDQNPEKLEFAGNSLILMRNEQVIRAVIEKANTEQEPQRKKFFTFLLSQMEEQRTTVVADRRCLDEQQSKTLYQQLIEPALTGMKGE
ncbi:MAG: hypothetical protein ACE5GL_00125 [Calditrichia bacterium]